MAPILARLAALGRGEEISDEATFALREFLLATPDGAWVAVGRAADRPELIDVLRGVEHLEAEHENLRRSASAVLRAAQRRRDSGNAQSRTLDAGIDAAPVNRTSQDLAPRQGQLWKVVPKPLAEIEVRGEWISFPRQGVAAFPAELMPTCWVVAGCLRAQTLASATGGRERVVDSSGILRGMLAESLPARLIVANSAPNQAFAVLGSSRADMRALGRYLDQKSVLEIAPGRVDVVATRQSRSLAQFMADSPSCGEQWCGTCGGWGRFSLELQAFLLGFASLEEQCKSLGRPDEWPRGSRQQIRRMLNELPEDALERLRENWASGGR